MILNPIIKKTQTGQYAHIIATAPTGSTVTCDGVVGTEVSGTWTFNIDTYGTHTVIGTLGSSTDTKTVTVTTNTDYTVTLSYGRLPSGYTEVEYIQSSGTQYIDTGYTPNSTTKVVADCLVSASDPFASIFGASAQQFCIQSGGTESRLYRFEAELFGYSSYLYNIYYTITFGNRYTFTLDAVNNIYSVNTTIYNISKNSTTPDTPIYLFRKYNEALYITGNMYSVVIYESDVIVHNFVPCINPSNEVGMYDLISATFFGNSGTGTFTAGDPV